MPLQHLRHEVLRIVHELLHAALPFLGGRPPRRPVRTSPRRRSPRRRASRCCARPCRQLAHVSRSSPSSPRPASARSSAAFADGDAATRRRRAPPPTSRRPARSASSSVLSPRSDWPRCLMPSIDARSIAITSSLVSSVLPAARPPPAGTRCPRSDPRYRRSRLVIDDADLLQERPDVRPIEGIELGQHDLEAPRHRVAEVAVADDRVEVAEVGLVVDRRLRHRLDDQVDLLTARAHPPLPPSSGPVPVRPGQARGQIVQGDVGPRRLGRRASQAPRSRSPPGSPSDDTTSAASERSSFAV